ncbi:MAG: hypothetical protein ACLFSM_01155 [Thermoplasmata archaeon]
MENEGSDGVLKKINEKTKEVRESRLSIPVYIFTVFIASLWVIFMNPCLMNLVIPILAILIPYKLYDEYKLRKLIVVGLTVIILIAFSMAFYQTEVIYGRPSRQVDSAEGKLVNGTVEPVYGDGGTKFNFTVELSEEFVENHTEGNYKVFANLSYTQVEGLRRDDFDGYMMERVDSDVDKNGTVEFFTIVTDLPDRLFNHYFSLKRNISMSGEEDYDWERTSLGFGPVTLNRRDVLGIITFQQSISTLMFFFLGVGILWLKRRMDKSISESTEGLEEKEEELEDNCPECGHLLEGKKECIRCGWVKEPEDEMYDEEGEPDV